MDVAVNVDMTTFFIYIFQGLNPSIDHGIKLNTFIALMFSFTIQAIPHCRKITGTNLGGETLLRNGYIPH